MMSLSHAATPDGILRAGVAKTDITPTKPVMLAGYDSRKGLSQGVHDPLSARVVAFEHGGQRLVLVSTDILGIWGATADAMQKAILGACRLKPSELFLSAIHTHSAPWVTFDPTKVHPNNVEYAKTLQDKLVEVIRTALDRLAPVQVGVGSGWSPVGVNRREVFRDKAGNTKTWLGRNPSVLTDREVQVLKLTRPSKRIGGPPASFFGGRPDRNERVAVLFAYATHSTSLGPENYLVSGDVHGLAEQFVERYFGPDVVAAAFAGASGDVDPCFRVLPGFNTANGWIPEPVLVGTMLGEEVAHVLEGIQTPGTSGPVHTMFKTVALPGRPRGEAPTTAAGPPVAFNITIGRVGDSAFVGLGGEVFNEIGKANKSASPFPHTFVITLCNGGAGYLPTRPSYAEGGYEVQSSPFAPGAADVLVEEVGLMLRELWKAQ